MKHLISKQLNNLGSYTGKLIAIGTTRSGKCEEGAPDDLLTIFVEIEGVPYQLPLMSIKNMNSWVFSLDAIAAALNITGTIEGTTQKAILDNLLKKIRAVITDPDKEATLYFNIEENKVTSSSFDVSTGETIDVVRVYKQVRFTEKP